MRQSTRKKGRTTILGNQRGAVLIWFVLFLPILIGMAAMAIDVTRLAVAKNELQNAADAGALAAARFLYNEDGTQINTGANQIGIDAATANKSENLAVEVSVADVQRGHWSFGIGNLARGFTSNASTGVVSLWGVTTAELDADTNFINAVQVTAHRQTTPVYSYFARIFGIEHWFMQATAVAYIGFAGSLAPGDVDAPVAICKQSVTGDPSDSCESNGYDCNIGYMLSDGEDKNTAAWTNYSQPCVTANPTNMHPLLTCAESNPVSIELGSAMGAVNGVQDNLIDSTGDTSLMGCWRTALWDSDGDDVKDAPIDADGDGLPEQLWNITLPVVNCPYSKVGNCMEVCGAVNVNIVWILRDAQTNKIDEQAPYKMADWNMEGVTDGKARWNSFVDHFNLKMPNGEPAYYVDSKNPGGFMKKSIYFLPDCTPHELKGKTGGENFGILARIPVLVH